MTWILLRLSTIATVCAVACVIGGIVTPTIALACEGIVEEIEEKEEKGLNELKFFTKNEEKDIARVGAAQKVLKAKITKVAGEAFTLVEGCVGKLRPPCVIKIKGPANKPAEGLFEWEVEEPDGSGKTHENQWKLVFK